MKRKSGVEVNLVIPENLKTLSNTKSGKVQKALVALKHIPSGDLLNSSYKVKKVSDSIYSYRVDMNSRIVFGEKDNNRVVLDLVDTTVLTPHHGGSVKAYKSSIHKIAAKKPSKFK